MLGLMQEHPLDIPTIVRHAERMHPGKSRFDLTAEKGEVTAIKVPFKAKGGK